MKPEIVQKLDCMSPQFVVSDLKASIRFYTEELGFGLNFVYEDFYAGIDCNGHSIHLKLGSVSLEERKRKREDQDLDVTFGVLGIEGVYEEIRSKTVEIVQPLRVMPYGTDFHIADPDGYLIGFFSKE